MNPNRMQRFLFDSHVAHGAFVELSDGLDAMLGHRDYGADVRSLVAQTLGALPMLATHLSFEGRISLQFQGDGVVKLLVGQIDHHLQLRAMAKAEPGATGNFAELLEEGRLALMLEPADRDRPPSQAFVPIVGQTLAQALEGYFEQSEQLPTLIRLASDQGRVRGFLLQRLPERDAKVTDHDWEHLWHLASTLTDAELLAETPETLLRRLFHEEAVLLLDPQPVEVSCRCSPDGIARLLLSLGEDEVDSILEEQGKVEVTCEFCGREYHYTPLQARELFAAAGTQPSETRH